MKITQDQVVNRIMAGISVTKKGGKYLAKSFSSEKTFGTEKEAQQWLNRQGL